MISASLCGKAKPWGWWAKAVVVRRPPHAAYYGLSATSGEILFREADGKVTDLAKLDRPGLRRFRPQMQMIFQDPFGSLNPRMTIFDIVGEPMYVNGLTNRSERTDRVAELLKLVGLRQEYMRRYPHAFSGGQRQRIGIARALALNPRLVVADEPVSALDVSVQAQVLNLMLDLQEKLQLTYLFVAHDLSVVKHICDRVCVMYVGKIVEMASTEELFYTPYHPYTAALMMAVPVPDPTQRHIIQDLPGEVASPADPPSGCYFHPRCEYAQEICRTETPQLRELSPDHFVSCHRLRASPGGINRVAHFIMSNTPAQPNLLFLITDQQRSDPSPLDQVPDANWIAGGGVRLAVMLPTRFAPVRQLFTACCRWPWDGR
jgi:peptide/nickel transport system ATP-binding protein